MNKVIAVDFDGTLCRSKWPEIGEANDYLIEWLKERKSKGDKLILFTCREGNLLSAAVMWCKARELEFDAVNDNLPEMIEVYGDNPRKISADLYMDDRAVNVFFPTKQGAVAEKVSKVPPKSDYGYQYHAPKAPLRWRARQAWRVLRGRKA